MRWIIDSLRKLLGYGDREIFYIGGCDVLPPPLKGQEEQSALAALEAGEEDAKQRLIEHNLRLVVFIAVIVHIDGFIQRNFRFLPGYFPYVH